jgi:hypothetical protein
VANENPGSVSHSIAALKTGNHAAAQSLWERFFEQLAHLARNRFPILREPGAIEEEEDPAPSAFKSVYTGLTRDRYPDLSDRCDLWRLLVLITTLKAINHAERWGRQKRGAGRLAGEAYQYQPGAGREGCVLDQLVGPDPTPEFLAIMAEEYQRLLALLNHPELRLWEIVAWWLGGFSTGMRLLPVSGVPGGPWPAGST